MPVTDNASGFRGCAGFRAVCVALSLLAGAHAAFADQAALAVTNAPGSLVFDAAGEKTLRFHIAVPATSDAASLQIDLLRYSEDATVVSVPVASYRKRAARVVSMDVDLPGPGLFAVDARLVARNGATIDARTISLAAVRPVQRSALPDAGVVTHFGQGKGLPEIVLPLVRRAGFSWIRDELYWDSIETKPGEFVFPRAYDHYIEQASRFGIKPLIVLDYSNQRAYPDLFKGPQGFPRTPQERGLFDRYATKLVARYGKTVKHWEVWNEPEFAQIGMDNYEALLTGVYIAVKRQSPDASVISCGGGGAGGGPGGDCITEILNSGARDAQDGFSVHPYMTPYDPDTGYRATDAPVDSVSIPSTWPYLKGLLEQNATVSRRSVGLWITEIGWPSSPASSGLSATKQAESLVRSFLLSRRYKAVEAMFWYDFVNDGNNPAESESNFGLLNADLTPKPAFVAAAVLARTLGARKWDRTILESGTVKVYQYGTGEDAVIAGWRTDASKRPVRVPVPRGNYVRRDWQGVSSPVVVPAEGLDWNLGTMPQYLVPAKGRVERQLRNID